MAEDEVVVTGGDLSLADVERVARDPTVPVRLAPDAREAVERSRSFLERRLEAGEPLYGVNTGFGRLAEVAIPPERRLDLQRNLVRSHCTGMGEPLAPEEVRAILLLRANALALGCSGCRVALVERLLEYLRREIHPVVPAYGSAGASGDLAPLAHVAATLVGEGDVEWRGRRRPVAAVLDEEGLRPLELKEKEGLALVNGTQATTALGVLALRAAERAVRTADVAGAMSLEGLRGTPRAFREEVQAVRPHPGQARTADRLRALLRDSEIRESHRHGDPRVQDAYSLRCMPQVHGAVREATGYVRRILETEVNSATDNPLVFADEGAVVSAGNFHGQIVSQALDLLCMAVADLAAVSERRVERLLNPDLSGLAAFLATEPGIESGLMMAQVTAVDVLGELRTLAHPASVDTVPTSANQEDHVSMGFASARKARRAVRALERVLAVELLCGAEAVDRLRPLRAGRGVERAHAAVRREVRPLDGDRALADDLERLRSRIADGAFAGEAP